MYGETSFIKSSFWCTLHLKTGFLLDSYELEITIGTFNAGKTRYDPSTMHLFYSLHAKNTQKQWNIESCISKTHLQYRITHASFLFFLCLHHNITCVHGLIYTDTSANEDNSFRNHIR